MSNKNSENRNPLGPQSTSFSDRAHDDTQTHLAKLFLLIFVALVGFLLLVLPGLAALEPANSSIMQTNSTLGPTYGVAFITSAEGHADEQQFANALATGARWDRWPVYWFAAGVDRRCTQGLVAGTYPARLFTSAAGTARGWGADTVTCPRMRR